MRIAFVVVLPQSVARMTCALAGSVRVTWLRCGVDLRSTGLERCEALADVFDRPALFEERRELRVLGRVGEHGHERLENVHQLCGDVIEWPGHLERDLRGNGHAPADHLQA